VKKNMSVESIFGLQIVGMILLFALMAAWYWARRLTRRSLEDALTALLLVHLARVLGLTLLEGQGHGVDPSVIGPVLIEFFEN
jgi:hypothetical protein